MIKLAMLLKRKKGMSFEEFDRYWSGPHADLLLSVPNFTRHVRRYCQSHVIDPSYGGEGLKWPKADFDGIAEVWFDSIDDMNRAFSEPDFVEKAGSDDLNFVDRESVTTIITEELEKIAPNGEAGVKLSVAMRRRPGMSFEDFDNHWTHNHWNLITSVPEFTRHLRRYVQCHLVPEYAAADNGSEFHSAWGEAKFDGLAELYFDNVPSMVAAFNEPKFLEVIGPDDGRYTDIPRTELLTVREVDIIAPRQKTAVN